MSRKGGDKPASSGALTSFITQRTLFSLLFVTVLAVAYSVLQSGDALDAFIRDTTSTDTAADIDNSNYSRTTVYFMSGSDKCEAWLYLPKNVSGRPPVVVMAHGLGGQKDMGLHFYAEPFTLNGFAVLVFDYRTFGGSDGEPRHWASPKRHLEDWVAAIQFLQDDYVETIDVNRLSLWGTSFSGGHALVTAAKLGTKVKAVVAQVPFLSGRASAREGIRRRGLLPSLRLLLAGVSDRVRSMLGAKPLYVRLVGGAGQLAMMQLDDYELEKYFRKHPPKRQGGWKNQILARLVLELSQYSPASYLREVMAPVMLVSGSRDHLCPPGEVRAAAEALRSRPGGNQEDNSQGVQHMELDVDHFQLYAPDVQRDIVAGMVDFVRAHVVGGQEQVHPQ